MLGQVAGHRRQRKPRMRWLDSIKEATGLRLEDIKEAVQDRKKMACADGRKPRNRERTNVKQIQEKAMANHSCTAKLA
jgi:DNA-binding transcriptional MerR regulator